MALSATTPRDWLTGFSELTLRYPVAASTQLYEGDVIASSSGYAGAAAGDGTDVVLGVCGEDTDNSAGAAGDKEVPVRAAGALRVPVTGASAVTDVNSAVYWNGSAFTLTSTDNTRVGTVLRWISSTTCLVYFFADTMVPA